MASIFNVEASVLAMNSGVLEGNSKECENLAQKLLGVYESMGSSYISEDNKQFGAKINELCTQMRLLAEKLHNGAEVLSVSGKSYESREDANSVAASRLP
jgi:hypothetical protein